MQYHEWAKNLDHFLKFITWEYDDTEKWFFYICGTLSGVRMPWYCEFYQVKYSLHYSSKTILHQKNNDSLFTCHGHLRYLFSELPDSIEAVWSIDENVQYFIRVRLMFWISSVTVRYALQKCSETILCLKVTILHFCVTCIREQKTYRVVRTSVWLISHSGMQQKTYRQEIRDIDHMKRVLLHCWLP